MHLKRSLLISHRLQGSQLESSATAKTCFGSSHSYQVSKFRAQKYLVVSHNFQWPCMGPPSMLNDGKASALRCTLRCIISSVKPPQTVVKSVWYNELFAFNYYECMTDLSSSQTSSNNLTDSRLIGIVTSCDKDPNIRSKQAAGHNPLQLLAQHRATFNWWCLANHTLAHLHTCTLTQTHTHTHTYTPRYILVSNNEYGSQYSELPSIRMLLE